jgi:Helix-loop-helix DNA-binding domain
MPSPEAYAEILVATGITFRLEQARRFVTSSRGSENSDDDSDSEFPNDNMREVLEDLKSHTRCLYDLIPAIDCPAKDTDHKPPGSYLVALEELAAHPLGPLASFLDRLRHEPARGSATTPLRAQKYVSGEKDIEAGQAKEELDSVCSASTFQDSAVSGLVSATALEEPEDYQTRSRPMKTTVHNIIEKRYRSNLNDKISALRDSVPSLRLMARHEDDDDVLDELEGLTPARKLSKATILSKATEYIRHLEKRNNRLNDQVISLKIRLDYFEKLLMQNAKTPNAALKAEFWPFPVNDEDDNGGHKVNVSPADAQGPGSKWPRHVRFLDETLSTDSDVKRAEGEMNGKQVKIRALACPFSKHSPARYERVYGQCTERPGFGKVEDVV